MKWDDLKYLLTVRQQGSLAAAARVLRVDQTTVGRRIESLEKNLGARLLERNASGCRLTPAGQRACAAGETMEASLQHLERQVTRSDEQITGVVRIAVAGGFVPVLLPALIQLRRSHPNLTVAISARTDLSNLVKREADLAIRHTSESQPSLVTTRLGSVAWSLYASRHYIESFGRAAPFSSHAVIGLDDMLRKTTSGRWLAEHASGSRETIVVNDLISGAAAAAAGLGLIVLPNFIAAQYPDLKKFRPDEIARTDFFLVARPDALALQRVRVIANHLTAYLRTRAASLSA